MVAYIIIAGTSSPATSSNFSIGVGLILWILFFPFSFVDDIPFLVLSAQTSSEDANSIHNGICCRNETLQV